MFTHEYLDRALRKKKLVLFGAGQLAAETIILYLERYEIAYICDNDSKRWGAEFMGLAVVSPERLLTEKENSVLVLITSMFRNEIAAWLLEHNLLYADLNFLDYPLAFKSLGSSILMENTDKVQEVLSLLADNKSREILTSVVDKRINASVSYKDIYESGTYFNDIFSDCMTESEAFVDAGVYDGNTIIDFIRYAKNKYNQIYGFEPDPDSFTKTNLRFSAASEKIKLFNFALSDTKAHVRFNTIEYGSSHISEAGGSIVQAERLDDIIQGKVTFIKADVEGSEYKMLLGAENIIKTYMPKLAICIYHKPEDLWEIPLLIHKMVPEYKLYIRHHSAHIPETVLYAKQ